MKKLKLLLATLALCAGVCTASAYTTSDLETAGWSKVTASSITGTGDNYYVLVDAHSSNYVMSCEANKYRPCYKAIGDPVENPSFVWILEGSDNKFTLKSYASGAYFKQVSGWDTTVGHGRGKSNVTAEFTLNNGKYDIKCLESNAMVGHWNDGEEGVASDGENIAANKSTNHADGFFLYEISKATYDAAVIASRASAIANATKATPADVTAWIHNADWSDDWGGWECTVTSSGNMQWGQQTLESWNASNVIVKQELKGVPNGLYKVTADLISGNNNNMVAYVFGTGDAKVSSDAVSAVASAGDYGTMSNEVAGKTLTADNVSVTGNTITLGFDQASGWIVADNFKLYYYGPNLAVSAALPDGEMTADTWYFFDVPMDGNYKLTCATLSDIVYTTDGSILVEDAASVMATFAASSAELNAGRYYVKSSSAQTLTVVAASYSYNVGEATASITEGSYQKTLSTVSFNFADAASNDPDATFSILHNTVDAILKKEGTAVTTGELSLVGTTLTATFSGVTLDMASSYAIELPADVVGYAGNAQNAAITVSFNTPAIADGLYYFYNTDTKKYMSRGGNWGTQAITDDYGVPAYIEFDTNGTTKVKFFDNFKFLSDGGWLYADNASGGNFTVEVVTNGYKFKDATSEKYVALYDGMLVGDAVEGINLQGTSNIWALETPAVYADKDNATTLSNAQAAAAANSAGLSGIKTLAALESELASNYGETTIAITGAQAEKYNENAGSNPLVEKEYVKETVNDLKPGLYRLTVDAFQRASSNERVAAADGASSLVYVYAGSAKTRIKSVMEYGANAAYSGDFEYNDKHYPNNETSGYEALSTGNYTNVVYVYVEDKGEGTGSLTFGINNPQNTNAGGWPNALWAIYNNFTLTYYEAKASTEEKGALADAISNAEAKTLGFETNEYAPYNNVAALEALADAKAVDPDAASGSAVVAATNALTGATWTANAEEVNAFYKGDFADYTEDTTTPLDYTPNGWTASDNFRMMLKNVENYPGLADASATSAVMSWSNGITYGETTGYEMPLKPNTVYTLKLKAAGWNNEARSGISVSILNGTDGMALYNLGTPDRDIVGNANNTAGMTSYEYVFTTGAAGNYVFHIQSGNNMVITDFEIKKAASQVLELAENTELPNYAPGTYPTVTITRTIKKGFNTLVLPFSMTQAEVEDVFGKDSKVYVVSSYDEDKKNISFDINDGINANKPCLLKATEASNGDYTLENRTIVAGEPVANGDKVSMTGTYKTIYVPVGNYIISGDMIYEVDSDEVTLRGTRAYITIDNANGARTLTMSFDDTATGIATLKDGKLEFETGDIYDLSGRKVKNPTKGIYLMNGKKVIK